MSNPNPAPNTPLMRKIGHFLSNAVIRGVIKLALLLPYGARVRFFGALMQRIIGPLVGYRRRALKNLAMIRPDLSAATQRQIASACLNNAGRTFIENYSAKDFPAFVASMPPKGPGLKALEQAAAEGRPVILVTGHFGNYEAARNILVSLGFPVGALYRNMANPYFNAHYVKTIADVGGPVFSQGRKGTAGFVRHLKNAGQMVLLFDIHVQGAPVLDFMGAPARTAISAAEMALRYDALLIPFFSIRQPDGLRFETVLEAPVAHSDAMTMTQTLNDRLGARIAANPEQWFWVHRRWRAHHP